MAAQNDLICLIKPARMIRILTQPNLHVRDSEYVLRTILSGFYFFWLNPIFDLKYKMFDIGYKNTFKSHRLVQIQKI